MSIVIRESHANNSQPLWLSAAGGTVDGDLIVTGNIESDKTVASSGGNTDTFAIMKWDNGQQVAVFGSLNEATPPGPYLPIWFQQFSIPNAETPMVITATQDVGIGTTTPSSKLEVVGAVTAEKLILPTTGPAPTAGVASIPSGSDNVVVNTTAVTADSIILTTRMGNASAGPGIGTGQQAIMVQSSQIVPGVSFEAFLVDPATGIKIQANTVSADFSWVIIN